MTIDEGGNFIWLELFETLNTAVKRRDGRRVGFQSSDVIDGLRPCYASPSAQSSVNKSLMFIFITSRAQPRNIETDKGFSSAI